MSGPPTARHAVDLRRLVAIIAEELAAYRGAPAAALRAVMACSSTAARRGCRACSTPAPPGSGSTPPAAAPAASPALIDHTLLKPDATADDIETLCREAAEYSVRDGVRQSRPGWRWRRGGCAARGVGVCSVVGFPLGATTADVKAYETRRAIVDGATEIDMVINVGALKSGELRLVEQDIEAVATACRACGVTSKVIIEAALLSDDEKVTACTLAKAAGADFVKTSTGFGPGGATAADVALMRRVVGDAWA